MNATDPTQGLLFRPIHGGGFRANPSVQASAPAHHNAPPCSSDAAAKAIERQTGGLRERVLAYIRSRGTDGATDQETQAMLGLACQTQTPRRRELAKAGAVVDSGRRRLTQSGRAATVWIAAEFAGGEPPGAEKDPAAVGIAAGREQQRVKPSIGDDRNTGHRGGGR